ncbi:hypothetical protein HDU76_000823 [Blyttiomyces sp. JEL0837]|nr:hypothetical protein HDU76_000823 [Blyttiomyces sp. JEL0837]
MGWSSVKRCRSFVPIKCSMHISTIPSPSTILRRFNSINIEHRNPLNYNRPPFSQQCRNKSSSNPNSQSLSNSLLESDLNTGLPQEELEDLYKLLSSPVSHVLPSAPDSVTASKLDADYLKNLQLSFLDTSTAEQLELEHLKQELAFDSLPDMLTVDLLGLGGNPTDTDGTNGAVTITSSSTPTTTSVRSPISMATISKVIHVNALLRRVKEAQEAFDLIPLATGSQPDLIAINHLMDAYARTGDLQGTARTFKQIWSTNQTPDIFSYSILIKACVAANDLKAAFRVYESMKRRNVQPNLPIFTTLIKGCLKDHDLARAWKTFDYMRGEICEPDSVAFSLMIHACAIGKEAERALDLFKEMAERGLHVTEVTYTSLIQACGSRPDYYAEAWVLFRQMLAEGFKPTLRTYQVLLRSAANVGDVTRARGIWNALVKRGTSEDRKFMPDEFCVAAMFDCLARLKVGKRDRTRSALAQSQPVNHEEFIQESLKSIAQEASEEKDGKGVVVRDIPYLPLDSPGTQPTMEPEVAASLEQPAPSPYDISTTVTSEMTIEDGFLNGSDSSAKTIMAEAEQLWSYYQSNLAHKNKEANITTQTMESEHSESTETETSPSSSTESPSPSTFTNTTVVTRTNQPTVNMTDRYLAVFCEMQGNLTASTRALQIYDTVYDPISNPKTGNTFAVILKLATRDKKVMNTRGDGLWQDLMRWDEEREVALKDLEVVGGKMSREEIENVRSKEGRRRKEMLQNFIFMVQGYTRLNNIPTALDFIEKSTQFREPYYLPPIQFKNVTSLVEKISDMAEGGDLEPARRLKALCPPPADNPVEEVKRILKTQWVGRNWWGWEALGIDENVRKKIMRKQEREKLRAKQYWDAKRKK